MGDGPRNYPMQWIWDSRERSRMPCTASPRQPDPTIQVLETFCSLAMAKSSKSCVLCSLLGDQVTLAVPQPPTVTACFQPQCPPTCQRQPRPSRPSMHFGGDPPSTLSCLPADSVTTSGTLCRCSPVTLRAAGGRGRESGSGEM
jgi:hypothetical protein